MKNKEEEMEAVSTSHQAVQGEEASRKIDILSLGVALVKEIREQGLNSQEVQGLLKLVEKLLKKENLL